MATYAKFVHNGKIHTVALYEGLDPKELLSLLKSVFTVQEDVVGVLGEVNTNYSLIAVMNQE